MNRRQFIALGTIGLAAGLGLDHGFTRPVSAQTMLEDRFEGAEDAPVTMIEYASLTCPHCATFHKDVLPAIRKAYIETGKLRLVIRDFPLDQRAAAAALLTRCAPEDIYHSFIDVLFDQQVIWATADDFIEMMNRYGRFAGMSDENIEACFTNQPLYEAIINGRSAASETYGIRSTPSFVINGEVIVGAQSFEDFAEVIDEALSG